MSPRFQLFIPFLWEWEGTVFEDDPDDRGGATKYGIDKASHPNEDIRNLTEQRAKEIYWKEYWTPLQCEALPEGVGEVVMDIGVNNGKSRAAKWLQTLVGVKVDGDIGPKTIEATTKQPKEVLIRSLLLRREGFYYDIAKGRQAKFLKGWLNRNDALGKFVGSGYKAKRPASD